ncbi:MAG: ATP-binding protein [Deltaproteobacteria bacterium]|nr:ATP-binding protein [Deltaproteobacteria bacterium]
MYIKWMFILLGSTEFSKMTLIRESLTGRMSRLRLFPLNLAEVSSLKANSSRSAIFANEKTRISRRELMRYLERGGMPGMFAIRDESERIALLEDWLAQLSFPDRRPPLGEKKSVGFRILVLSDKGSGI